MGMTRRPLGVDMPITDATKFAGTDPILNRLPAALFTDEHDRRCMEKHGKPLKRVAEEGGLTSVEVVILVCGTSTAPGREIAAWEAHRVLRSIVHAFRRGYNIGTGID